MDPKQAYRNLRFGVGRLVQELEEVEHLAGLTERFLQEEHGSFEKWLETEAAELSEEDQETLVEQHSDREWELKEVFPALIRSSLLLSAFAMVEDYVVRAADLVHAVMQLRLSRKDLKGSGIVQAHTYLSKVARLPLEPSDETWKDVDLLREIRNSFAHARGRISGNDTLKRAIESHEHLRVDSRSRILLNSTFLPWALDILVVFAFSLDEALTKVPPVPGAFPERPKRDA